MSNNEQPNTVDLLDVIRASLSSVATELQAYSEERKQEPPQHLQNIFATLQVALTQEHNQRSLGEHTQCPFCRSEWVTPNQYARNLKAYHKIQPAWITPSEGQLNTIISQGFFSHLDFAHAILDLAKSLNHVQIQEDPNSVTDVNFREQEPGNKKEKGNL